MGQYVFSVIILKKSRENDIPCKSESKLYMPMCSLPLLVSISCFYSLFTPLISVTLIRVRQSEHSDLLCFYKKGMRGVCVC